MDKLTPLLDWIKNNGQQMLSESRSLLSIAVILITLLSLRLITKLTNRRIDDVAKRYAIRKTFTYTLVTLSCIALLHIWIEGRSGFASYLGLLSAGVAIALKDPLTNLVAWLFILTRKPFVTGDRIQIGDRSGDVIDQRPFAFTILEIGNWVNADQATGRIIHIPNGCVFTKEIACYNQGFNFIWNEIPVMITFESDWEKATEILEDIGKNRSAIKGKQAEHEIRKAAQKYLIYFHHLTPIVWTSVGDSGVILTIRYLCAPRQRRTSESLIWKDILHAFAEAPDIELAYPTQRFYTQPNAETPLPNLPPFSGKNEPTSL